MGDRKVIAWVYLASGFLSALAGLIIASRTSAASPDFGSSYILLAIVIVVLGGVNPMGGFGTVTKVRRKGSYESMSLACKFIPKSKVSNLRLEAGTKIPMEVMFLQKVTIFKIISS